MGWCEGQLHLVLRRQANAVSCWARKKGRCAGAARFRHRMLEVPWGGSLSLRCQLKWLVDSMDGWKTGVGGPAWGPGMQEAGVAPHARARVPARWSATRRRLFDLGCCARHRGYMTLSKVGELCDPADKTTLRSSTTLLQCLSKESGKHQGCTAPPLGWPDAGQAAPRCGVHWPAP